MKKSTKQNIIIIIATAVILILAILVLSARKSGTISQKNVDFRVEDTSAVNWIFLADNQGYTVLLQRKSPSKWMLNKKEVALQANVNGTLSVMQNIAVKAPVSFAATQNVNKWLATGATKVEIAYSDYRIKIAKMKFWKYEKIKTYYIGSPTADNLGNYAIMEGSKMPFIVYMPGFRGFISPYYSALESDWLTHELINLRISQIKEVELKDLEKPESSFKILRHGDKHFDILALSSNQLLSVYDTLKLYDHLTCYRNLNFEFFANDMNKSKRDSILSQKFKEIKVTDTKGKITKINCYYILNEYNTEEFEYKEEFMELYDRDKFYITVNNDINNFYICQFFVFDRILQPLEYYFPGNDLRAIGGK